MMGKRRMLDEIDTCKMMRMQNRTANSRSELIRQDNTELNTRISLGKKIFLTNPGCDTIDIIPRLVALVKNLQVTIPVRMYKANCFSDILKIPLNTTYRMIIMNRGLIRDQAKPRTELWYFILRLLMVRT